MTRREQIIDTQALKTNRHLMSAATLNRCLRQHHYPPPKQSKSSSALSSPTDLHCQRVNGGEHLLNVNIE